MALYGTIEAVGMNLNFLTSHVHFLPKKEVVLISHEIKDGVFSLFDYEDEDINKLKNDSSADHVIEIVSEGARILSQESLVSHKHSGRENAKKALMSSADATADATDASTSPRMDVH